MRKKVVLSIVLPILALLTTVVAQKVDPKQYDPKINNRSVFPDTLEGKPYNLDSLNEIIGLNKTLPQGFEKAALLALAAYPQLKDVNIEMVLTNSGPPMESGFRIMTLFKRKSKRIYKISLNNAIDSSFEPILLRSLPFDAQVGILAHELGHVVYYENLNSWQIARWGLNYLFSKKFRSIHEKSTDMMPVYHGLGSQIYQYAHYVRHDPSCKPLYEKYGSEFIDKYYMTDEELKAAIFEFEKL